MNKKCFVTGAFPYMNGLLHAGHMRVFSTCDVIARYNKLKGKKVLFPMAFHITGTPIVATAEKIKNHINIGINLATDYKLPKIVIDIIKQHHGNSYVKYFLNKAKESKRIINISDFKYDGPLPNTKEAAIVMISDIVESTVKSLKRPSSEEMKEVIENSIKNLVIDKQLIDTQLTFSDLEKIKQTFIPILEGIYRHRVEYK